MLNWLYAIYSVICFLKDRINMKIVVTFFSWDNGHLDAINPLTSKDKLIKKIEDECEDIGDGWLEDYEVSLDDLRNSDGEKLIELCEKISSGGHLNVVDI